jgi:hypothetical protein
MNLPKIIFRGGSPTPFHVVSHTDVKLFGVLPVAGDAEYVGTIDDTDVFLFVEGECGRFVHALWHGVRRVHGAGKVLARSSEPAYTLVRIVDGDVIEAEFLDGTVAFIQFLNGKYDFVHNSVALASGLINANTYVI